MATATKQVRLLTNEVAATAAAILLNLKVKMKLSKLAQVTPEDTESYVKAKEGIRQMTLKKWVD